MLPLESITAGVAQTLAAAWEQEQGAAAILQATQEALVLMDHLVALVERQADLPKAIACQPGCCFCCYNQVELTPPEVLLIGQFLHRHLASATRGQILSHLKDRARWQKGLSKAQMAERRREHPCPFLAHERCLIYPVRPLMCRAMHAFDARHCQASLTADHLIQDEYYEHRHDLALAVSRGLLAAAAERGCQAANLNLVMALGECFALHEAAARWAAGERVFTAG